MGRGMGDENEMLMIKMMGRKQHKEVKERTN